MNNQRRSAVDLLHSPASVANFQTLCGVHKKKQKTDANEHHTHHISKMWLYWVMKFASGLGQEEFYVLFFPFFYWNIDHAIGRKVVFVWSICMYLGQCLKDWLMWPRPDPLHVVHLEDLYISEFGTPSTHAIVATSIPFSLVYFAYERYQLPLAPSLLIATTWCLLVSLSRVYMGMHSFLDISCGFALTVLLMFFLVPTTELIHSTLYTTDITTLLILALSFVLSQTYPQTEWTPARADTVACVATLGGVYLGSWFAWKSGYTVLSFDGEFVLPTFVQVGFAVVRMLVGLAMLAGTKFVCDSALDKVKERRVACARTQAAIKYLVYLVLSVVSVFVVPIVFNMLRIDVDVRTDV